MGTIDRRLTDLEARTGGGDPVTVAVNWGEPTEPRPGPGETVRVVTWAPDGTIESKTYRGTK